MGKSNRKPLRPTSSNKANDLHSAYLNESGIREIPITEKIDDNNIENENNPEEVDLEKVKDIKKKQKTKKHDKKVNAEIEELKASIQDLENEKNELKDQVMRKTAEMDNMRRRSLKEKNEMIDFANQRLLMKLLPLLDDFTKAIESGKSKHEFESVMQGIEMIYQKMQKVFEESGVKPMEDAIGKPFDVDFHEAVMQMPSDDVEEGNVIQVIEPGFMFFDRVLRHAKVITSSGKQEES